MRKGSSDSFGRTLASKRSKRAGERERERDGRRGQRILCNRCAKIAGKGSVRDARGALPLAIAISIKRRCPRKPRGRKIARDEGGMGERGGSVRVHVGGYG